MKIVFEESDFPAVFGRKDRIPAALEQFGLDVERLGDDRFDVRFRDVRAQAGYVLDCPVTVELAKPKPARTPRKGKP